ncbi:hypothetical protein F503_01375 [Ophiostoma piceae UAMH 11346]|uniref:Duf1479 domain protein n=1 Tax=Ophiostoma piceae (strain UAMH 11346) TaxID=1262450 RepID=S3BY31_OPHP1|nr:hypothetical protein F503_01375 [Ophiostoma piceae UAMH 11346]
MSLSADARPPSALLLGEIEIDIAKAEEHTDKTEKTERTEKTEPRKRKRSPAQTPYNAALTALHDLRDHLFADGPRADREGRAERAERANRRERERELVTATKNTDASSQHTHAKPERRRKLRYRAAVSVSESVEIVPSVTQTYTPASGLPPSLSAMDPPVLSFYGAEPVPLPSRFAQIKRNLAHGHHAQLKASWLRLLTALEHEVEHIHQQGAALIPAIAYGDIARSSRVLDFKKRLQTCGVGVIRGVVSPHDAAEWVAETRDYLQLGQGGSASTIKPPPPQDPTCFDYFWSPAQVRARAHPNVLKAMQFVMGFWSAGSASGEANFETTEKEKDEEKNEEKEKEPPRLSTRFPITYADRIRIHVDATEQKRQTSEVPKRETLMAQVDGGSLERWEPDGYGRAGTYDCIFRGRWEEYDPWDPAGRVNATPDLYNGAGACSIFRMFQGLLALTDVAPGVVRLLPSPKLATAYFLLRPFFRYVGDAAGTAGRESDWEIDESTIIHGAVPGHAQRVTELWHPHLQLQKSLVALPRLEPGDYIVWHCDTAYTIGGGEQTSEQPPSPAATTPAAGAAGTAPMIAYLPACPLTQTNALYLARQRKAFQRGHPGPDFDSTGTGLGSEAENGARLGEEAIGRWGKGGLRGMGLSPWPTIAKPTKLKAELAAEMEVEAEAEAETETETGRTEPTDNDAVQESDASLSRTELEVIRLANIILFPDQYEFYMPTRHNSPDR